MFFGIWGKHKAAMLVSMLKGSKRPREGHQDAPERPPRYPLRAPKRAPRGSKMAPRWPQDAPRGPKGAPRGLQEAPRGLQEASKRYPTEPHCPARGPKRPQELPI